MSFQGNLKKDIPMVLSKYTFLALNPNKCFIFGIMNKYGIYPSLLDPNKGLITVFSDPNRADFGIFLFFIINVGLSLYRLYVTPTTYL